MASYSVPKVLRYFMVLPYRVRLERSIQYYLGLKKNSLSDEGQAAKLEGTLIKWLLEEAKESPEHALKQLDVIGEKHDYFFNHLTDNPDDFLEFSRRVHQYRPRLLLPALRRCLHKFRFDRLLQKNGSSYRNAELYLPPDTHIRAISRELFLMLDSMDILQAHSACQQLITDAHSDEQWYSQLFTKLWQLEKDKRVSDSERIKNSYLIVLNSSNESQVWQQAKMRITEWLNSYKLLPQRVDFKRGFIFDNKADYDIFEHTKLLLKLINDAYHPVHFFTRNHDLSVPEYSFAIEMQEAYWSMVSWLQECNTPLVLHVLLAGIEPGVFATQFTQKIASESAQKFLNLFDKYLKADTENAAKLMGCMIDCTRCTGYKESFGKLLNEIYPELESFRPDLAKAILENAQKNNHSHSSCWSPIWLSFSKN